MRGVTRATMAIAATWAAMASAGLHIAAQSATPGATTVMHFSLGDPRQPLGGTLVNVTGLAVTHTTPPAHRAWFFELTDGSTCRPLLTGGRVIEDEIELFTCRWGSAGDADAVLGDLDASAPVWTIHKVLINKKSQPQTIKSLTVAPVRTVWQ